MLGTWATLYYFCSIIIAIVTITLAVSYRKQRNGYRNNCNAWEAEFSRIQGISHNFLNACRLIRIDRNGRMNVFTFARGDKIFTIETVGMLSDTPQAWREQAGLDQ